MLPPGNARVLVYEPWAHMVQLVQLAAENRPGLHCTQPATGRRLYWPAGQGVHAAAPDRCSTSVTEPAGQSVHAFVETVLKRPAAHSLQVVAPVLFKVFVVDPAEQEVHRVAPLELNKPAGQNRQAEDGS